jgi:formylmethanofuran dehydrogenase subunit B
MPEELCYHPEVMELREAIKGLQAEFVDTHKALDAAQQEVKCVADALLAACTVGQRKSLAWLRCMGRYQGCNLMRSCAHKMLRMGGACRTAKAASSQQLQIATRHVQTTGSSCCEIQLRLMFTYAWHVMSAVRALLCVACTDLPQLRSRILQEELRRGSSFLAVH